MQHQQIELDSKRQQQKQSAIISSQQQYQTHVQHQIQQTQQQTAV